MKKGDIVIAPEGDILSCFTSGREYEVLDVLNTVDYIFFITDDLGSYTITSFYNSPSLNGQDWILKEPSNNVKAYELEKRINRMIKARLWRVIVAIAILIFFYFLTMILL